MLAAELANEGALGHIRAAAGVAVKNALTAREAPRAAEYASRWLYLSEDVRREVKAKALQTLTTQESSASTQAGQVIASIASIEIPRGGWKDLIPQLLAASQDQENAKLRQAALQTIGFTCESLVSVPPRVHPCKMARCSPDPYLSLSNKRTRCGISPTRS